MTGIAGPGLITTQLLTGSQEHAVYVIRALAVSFAAALAVVAGIVAEKRRPSGSDYHRKNANDLACRIAQMDAQRCCHD
jgi:hypothetical protein